MKKALLCLFAVLTVFALRTALCESTTLMIYMAGSDLETRGAAACHDIEEMIRSVPEDGSVRVILLTGGAAEWHREEIPADACALWQVTSAGLEPVCLLEGSMGDAGTLSRFLTESVIRFPADRYALILWDHGGGPLGGVCLDETNGMDGLSMSELADALHLSPFGRQPLALIGFDACLMASCEVAAAVAPYAGYMLASEEPEPADGWDYSFLRQIGSADSGAGMAHCIADAYMSAFRDCSMPITISCVKLSGMNALNSALDRLFTSLSDAISPDLYEKAAFCRTDVKALGSASAADFDLVDLGDLLDEMDDMRLGDVGTAREALQEAVLFSHANEDYISGLSIYHPFDNKTKFTHPWAAQYEEMAFPAGYRRWIRAFSQILLGSSIASWRDTRAIQTQPQALKAQVQAELSSEETAHTVEARLLVLEEVQPQEYRLVWCSADTEMRNGRITAAYRGEALYALDEAGELLAGPLTWRDTEGGAAVGALLEDETGHTEPVWLIFRPDLSGNYRLYEVDTYNSGMDLFIPSALSICPGDSLIFASWARTLPDSDDRYENWPYGETASVEYLRVPDGGLVLKALPISSADRRIALFELRDTQSDYHLTAPEELPDLTSISITDIIESAESEHLALTLREITLLNGASRGLRIGLTAHNLTDRTVTATLSAVTIDGKALSALREHPQEKLGPNGEAELSVFIPAQALVTARAVQADQITLTAALRSDDGTAADESFAFSVGISFALLGIADQEVPIPLSAASAGDVSAALISCAFDESTGCIQGEILIRNNSEHSLVITGHQVWINGAEAYGSLCGGALPLTIPAGCRSLCAYSILPNDPVTGEAIPELSGSINCLTWKLLCKNSLITLTFESGLNEPQ